MMGLHKVEIKTDENGRTTVKVDGYGLHRVHSATARFDSGCYPSVELELYNINEIETSAFVEFAFSPETTQKACSVIRAACWNDDAFANSVRASIRASLHGLVDDVEGVSEQIFTTVFLGK